MKFALRPGGVTTGTIWIGGDRLPGEGIPPGSGVVNGYPILGEAGNTLRSRRIDRLSLPMTGDAPRFAVVGSTFQGVGALEVE